MIAIAFYVIAAITLGAAALVVFARNPVHAVLWLILTFFSAAGLIVLIGAEFLAMLLVVVYVGAVAVLFLFVVMMLDIDFAELKQGFLKYFPVASLVGVAVFAQLAFVALAWRAPADARVFGAAPGGASNAEAIGKVLYTDYFLPFQIAGLILLVAMVGAIVLTLRERGAVRRQDAAVQIGRDPKKAIELVKIAPGQGA
jgi:NADH dehydrogenase subunit J (EC 1.6.5.3)